MSRSTNKHRYEHTRAKSPARRQQLSTPKQQRAVSDYSASQKGQTRLGVLLKHSSEAKRATKGSEGTMLPRTIGQRDRPPTCSAGAGVCAQAALRGRQQTLATRTSARACVCVCVPARACECAAASVQLRRVRQAKRGGRHPHTDAACSQAPKI